MSIDPRAAVIVGVGQINQRVDRGDVALEPVDLIVEAARAAAADSGAPNILAGLDSLRIVSLLSWRYHDPGALVAERVGATPKHTLYTGPGGNTPQSLVNRTARDIASGAADVVLIGGAEAWRTRSAMRNDGGKPSWTIQDDTAAPSELFGGDLNMIDPREVGRGIALPVQVYPMFEQALRGARGRTIDEHIVRVSELWARFSEVAADNPAAWIQRSYTAEEIRTATPDNRMIGFPYTKLMNSNNAVEQGAALLVCSVEAAERLGVPRDRWVFPHAGTDGHDTYAVSERGDLHSSPAIRVCGREALAMAGASVDDLAFVDLYSCFPSAVEVAAAELGLPDDDPSRPLTVTGGLSFAGGPWNNYVTHAIATMAMRLRSATTGALGLCTANGGFLTKHAIGVYGIEPPADGFRWADVQDAIDAATTPRDAVAEHEGSVAVESWTVMHDREGAPEAGFAAVLLPDGRRAWSTTKDADALKTMVTDDLIGAAAHLARDGTLSLS